MNPTRLTEIPRRTFMAMIAGGLLAAPLVAQAQQPRKIPRVAFLYAANFLGPLNPAWREAFRQGMREAGWMDGRNVVIDERIGNSPEENREISATIQRDPVDVVVAIGPSAFLIAPFGPAPIRGIPIVFAGVSDPLGAGMVASLARPGGNMTGFSYLGVELNVKRLQLLKEAVPEMTRVGVLAATNHPLRDRMVKEVEAAARGLKVTSSVFMVATTDPATMIDAAFEAMAKERVAGVLVLQGPHFYRERKRFAELEMKHRLPAIFELGDYAEAGCLMAYAPSLREILRMSAYYVDKILKGAKPADLPVEQPTKFELVINLKTAKALGLTIPQSLLIRADQVIE